MSKEKAVDYFDRHSSSTECHITSDGRVFHTIGAAQGFASGLKDDTVDSFTRAEIEVDNIPVVGSQELTPEGSAPENLDAKLLAFDTTTANYPEIIALTKELKLAADSNKKEHLVAAILAAQESLKPQV